MSQTIDSKVVEMKFDNSDFESNVKQSMSTLDKLKKDLNMSESAESFKEISKAAKDVSFDGLSSGIDTVKSHFSALEVVATGALWNITQRAVDAGIAMAKSMSTDLMSAGWGQYEEKTKSVQTIMNATGESIDSVDASLEKLLWFTDETSYSFSDMTNNIGKFTSMGIGLDDSVSAMMGISNWAAVSGAGINEASRAMYNLSQAMGVGAVTLQDWKSIENANMATKEFKQQVIDAAKALGTLDEYGFTSSGNAVNTTNFTSYLSKDRWFTNDVLMKVLQEYSSYSDLVYDRVKATGEACSKAMEYVSAYGDSFSEVAEKAFKAAQEAKTFTDAVEAVNDAVKSQWATLFESIFGNYEDAKVVWTNLSNSLWEVFAGPLANVNEIVKEAINPPEVDLSTWNNIRDELTNNLGLTSTEMGQFEEVLKNVARESGIDIDTIISQQGGFAASLRTGWLNSELLNKSLTEMSESGVSAEAALSDIQGIVNAVWNGDYGNGEARFKALEELGYNAAEIQALVEKGFGYELTVDDLTESMLEAVSASQEELDVLNKIREALESGDLEVTEEFISQVSGKTLRDQFWGNLFDPDEGAIVTYFGAFQEAFSNVFGSLDSGDIRSFIEKLYEFSVKLLDEDRVARFQMRLENIFHVIHTVLNTLKGIWSVVKTLYDNTLGTILKGLWSIIVDIADHIGDLFANLDELTSSTTIFADAVDWLNEKLEPFKNVVESVTAGIIKFIDVLFGGESVGEAFENAVTWIILSLDKVEGVRKALKFKDFMQNLKDLGRTVAATFENIVNTIKNAWHAFQNTELGQYISGVVENIRNALESFWTAVTDWLKNLSGNTDDGDFILLATIRTVLNGFNEWISNLDLVSKMNEISDAVMSFKDSLTKRFNSISKFFEDNETVQKTAEVVKNAFDELHTAVKGTTKDSSNDDEKEPFFLSVIEKIKAALSWFKEHLPSLNDIINFVIGVLSSGTFISLISLIRKIKKTFSGGSGFVKNLNKVLGGVANALNAFAFKMLGEGILSIVEAFAAAVAVIVGALVILTLLDAGKLKSAADVLVYVAAAFTVIIAAVSKLIKSLSSTGVFDKKETDLKASLGNFLESIGSGLESLAKGAGQYLKFKGLAMMLVGVAAAMGVLAYAVYKLSELDLDRLAKGLGAVIILLGSLAGAMKLMTAGTSTSFSLSGSGLSMGTTGSMGAGTAVGFVGMALAVLVLVKAIDEICEYDLESLLKGVGTIGAILLEMSLAVRISGNSFGISNGLGMIAMAKTVLMFTSAIGQLTDYNLGELLNAVITIGIILLEIETFTNMVNGEFGIKQGVALIALAGSLLLMVKVIKQLSEIQVDQIGSGLGGLIVILASLAGFIWVLEKISSNTKDISTLLFSIAAIIAAVSAAVWVLADAINKGVNLDEIGKQLGLLISGLVSGLIDAIVNSADSIVSGVLTLLQTLSDAVPQMVPILVDLVVNLLNALAEKLPELAEALANFCGVLMNSFAEAFKDVDVSALADVINELLFATASLVIIGHFGDFKTLTKGIGMLAEVIGAFGLIIAAFGALNLIDGFAEFMAGGVDILVTIADGIGQFVGTLIGSLVGSTIESFTSSLPQIGTYLSDFMTNIKPFVDGCSDFDSSFFGSIGNLMLAMLAITGASFVDTVLNGIGKLFGYDAKADFISSFVELGNGIADFAESVSGIDNAQVQCATNAATALTALMGVIPAEGGLITLVTGQKDLDNVDTTFRKLGMGVALFCKAIGNSTVDEATVTSAATAIQSLMNIVPNQDGILQKIIGQQNFDTVDKTFRKLGLGVAHFCRAITGVSINSSTVSTAARAIKTLMNIVPNQNGVLQIFTGQQDFDNVDTIFRKLGLGVFHFCKAVAGCTIDSDTVDSAAKSITSLINIAPNTGGIWEKVFGKQDFDNVDTIFRKLGLGVFHFCKAIAGASISDDTVTAAEAAVAIVDKISAAAPKTGGLWQQIVGTTDLGELATNLGSLGTGIASFIESTNGTTRVDVTRAKIAAEGIIEILDLNWPTEGGIVGIFNNIIGGDVVWDDLSTDIESMGNAIKTFCDSINGVTEDNISTAQTVAEAIIEMLKLEWPTDNGFFGDLWTDAFGGDIVWGDLQQDIIGMAEVINAFSENIGGIEVTDVTGAKTAADAIIDLMGLEWPTDNGFFGNLWGSLFGSDNSINWDSLGQELPKMGAAITAFADSVSGIDETSVHLAQISGDVITKLLDSMPEDVSQLNNITTYGSNIETFGENISSFTMKMDDTNFVTVALAVSSIKSLISVLTEMSDVQFDKASEFSTALGTLAYSGINQFSDAFVNSEHTVINNVNSFVGRIPSQMDMYSQLERSGRNSMIGYYNGISSYSNYIYNLVYDIARYSRDYVDNYEGWRIAGYNSMVGFYNGIAGMANSVYNLVSNISTNALNLSRGIFGIHSPSTEFAKIGMYSILGLVRGFDGNAHLVYGSVEDVADGALNTMTAILSEMNFDDLDDAPVIRPVLDLSNIQNGASAINDLLYADRIVNLDLSETDALLNKINGLTLDGADINNIYDDTDVLNSINDLGSRMDTLSDAIRNIKLVLDGKTLVGGIVDDMNDALGRLEKQYQNGV